MIEKMLDLIKGKGGINGFSLDESCLVKLVYGNKFQRGKVWIIKLPNQNKTEFLEVKIKETSDDCRLLIEGNLRKWWYGSKSAINDLNYSAYCRCIELIAKRMGVDSKYIYALEFDYLEIGCNIKLPSAYERFLPSLLSYPELSIERWGSSSVYFQGSKFRLIFYDKLIEMRDRRIISSKVANKLRKHLFILRFEIKINSKSGYRKKRQIQTFGSIRDNWDEIIEDWYSSFKKAKIVDLFSEAREIKRDDLTPKETKEYGNFLLANEIGLGRVLYFFQYFSKNRKSEMVDYVQALYKKFTTGNRWNFYGNILKEAEARKDRLLRKEKLT